MSRTSIFLLRELPSGWTSRVSRTRSSIAWSSAGISRFRQERECTVRARDGPRLPRDAPVKAPGHARTAPRRPSKAGDGGHADGRCNGPLPALRFHNGAGHEVLARTCFPSEGHWDIQVCDTRDPARSWLDSHRCRQRGHACIPPERSAMRWSSRTTRRDIHEHDPVRHMFWVECAFSLDLSPSTST